MLPLGLVLLAQDIPPLQKPTALALIWAERTIRRLRIKWLAYRRSRRAPSNQ